MCRFRTSTTMRDKADFASLANIVFDYSVGDIWDNVKMLLEGSKLTKEDRESQLYDDFEHFRQNKGETIHDYYVRFAKLINDMRNIKMTMLKIQLNSKFVNNMLPEWGLVPNPAPAIPYAPPTNKELEMLFKPMFDKYFNLPGIRHNPIPNVAQDPVIPTGTSVSIAIDLDAPSGSHTSSPLDHHSSSV
ncbi:retrovirus-related pol polyprotein from transposon TNT 1-94, partial [Tanacetum coccineum]